MATPPENGAHLQALIAAATARAESYLGRALIEQTLVWTLEAFPGHDPTYGRYAATSGCWRLELPRPPLIEVVAIRYLDDDGALQTLDASLYRVSAGREPAVIEPAYGETWPTTRPVVDAVEVEYKAGYGTTAEAVPATIRQAMTLMVGEWLEFREGLVIGTIAEPIPHSARFLLDGERLGKLFAGGGEE